MRNILFWLAIPFLIPQALYVRRTAPRFKPASGPTKGSFGKGSEVRLLAIGDSIIAGVGASTLAKALVSRIAAPLSELLAQTVSWQALGVSGYDSARVLTDLVPQLPDESFDYIVVSVGVNDITGLTTVRSWRQNLSALLDALVAHSPDAVIAVVGMPPMHGFPLLPQPLRATFGYRARLFDHIAREVVEKRRNIQLVPLDFEPSPDQFSADGYHPSEDRYEEFGREMAEAILKMNRVRNG
jgi:lysophospholipase L1-like esterase